jgi:arabinose-5-phosphate isomerase
MPRCEEACPNGLAPTTSTTMMLALGDALAIALLEQRGFTARDFKLYHPGGKLGARLTFVRDVMHVGARMPVVPASATMGDAIIEISSKGFGCAGVVDGVGKLVGIFTDGDLRRHITTNPMSDGVEAVMTRAPRTVTPDALAAEALEILNSAKITALFAVDEGDVPRGIVHFHDLLRIGAA